MNFIIKNKKKIACVAIALVIVGVLIWLFTNPLKVNNDTQYTVINFDECTTVSQEDAAQLNQIMKSISGERGLYACGFGDNEAIIVHKGNKDISLQIGMDGCGSLYDEDSNITYTIPPKHMKQFVSIMAKYNMSVLYVEY